MGCQHQYLFLLEVLEDTFLVLVEEIRNVPGEADGGEGHIKLLFLGGELGDRVDGQGDRPHRKHWHVVRHHQLQALERRTHQPLATKERERKRILLHISYTIVACGVNGAKN